MTAVLGIFGQDEAGRLDERHLWQALGSAAKGPTERVYFHTEPGVLLGVTTKPTHTAQSCMVPPLAIDDNWVVAADASLYYVGELRRRLGSDSERTESPSRLILNAFGKFGAGCVDYLEGDFAFVVWDRRRRQVVCARDFTGRRPLFLAEWKTGLIVASSLDSIAAIPGFDATTSALAVGADAAGLHFSLDDETCMSGVRSLRAGTLARWSEGDRVHSQRFWHPSSKNPKPAPFDEAAHQLRDLLADAVTERSNAARPTAVWMSGGRDSTAVFAAGMYSRGRGNLIGPLLPISRSHPVGDSGRENEAVEEIASFWQVSPKWVDAHEIPMFALTGRTRWSDEPFAQPFEGLARGLAKAGVSLGAHVALDGYGGDFLFQVSGIYLSDLVRRGQVRRALSDWRMANSHDASLRDFFSVGVQPILPRWATFGLGALRGRPLRHSMERIAPPWITPRFMAEHHLRERFMSLGPAGQSGSSASRRETEFYLSHQFFARINSRMASFALDYGVELRSPLLDRRVVDFALSRPREERNMAGDKKRLLRAAMHGLLPQSVLATRRHKTGTLTSYFSQHMWNEGLSRLDAMMPAHALADAGIVDLAALANAIESYRAAGPSYPFTEALFCTLNAEAWLRARRGASLPLSHRQRSAKSA